MINNFSSPADQELCRMATNRAVSRYVTAVVSIIALHRSERSRDERHCRLCREAWPCRTVLLAVGAHQQTQGVA